MTHWLEQLRRDLDDRHRRHLLRQRRPVDRSTRLVRRDGRELINLAGNDYLALAGHPHLAEATAGSARSLGVGAGASRLVTGDLEIHRALEQRFAAFKHAEAALLCPTGFTANLAALTALAGEDDLILLDKLNHASLIDAARATAATVRVYPHGHHDKLRRLLDRHADARRRFIVTDAVFSMDGDCADLPTLCELRDRYEAVLMVDEAHGTGVLGETGAGLAEQQGVAEAVDVTVSTASKALGSLGGIVTAPAVVIETLVNAARSFIYTTAVPPTQAAAIDAALDVVRDEPDRRHRLAELSRSLRHGLRERGWPVPDDPTPIIPIIVGEEAEALERSANLEAAGFLIPAIRPPTVPPGTARLRLSLRCDLLEEDLERLLDALGSR